MKPILSVCAGMLVGLSLSIALSAFPPAAPNKNHYVMPIATWPDAWIHAKDLTITERTWRRDGVAVQDFAWK